MTDIELAKINLTGHTICLCKDRECIYSDKKGIAPMMDFIASGVDLSGYSVADLIVGKAVSMLFVKAGIKCVFAKTLSQNGKAILDLYAIPYQYEVLTENIINRMGTDICPMEKTVLQTSDIEEAYILLKNKLKSMQ